MAVTPDPIEDPPYSRPESFSAQAQSWSYQPQSAKAAIQFATNKAESTVVKAAYTETKPAKPAQEELPPTSLGMLRLTNKKRIVFHYDPSDEASTGAASLEIWGTTDMRNWRKFEVARSPSSLAVEVKDEGLYGFTMLARGKDEPKGEPPPGEPPQVWVAVDLTKPDVQLLDAEVNAQAQVPALIVRWTAKDRNFGPQPITVLYADRPEGPWRPLAANLENNGRCEGPLPPNLADNVYLRVQAADLVGNLGLSQITVLRSPGRPESSAARVSHPAASALSMNGEK